MIRGKLWDWLAGRSAEAPPLAVVGAFGKIPQMGDFLRIRAGGEPWLGFEAWLEQALAWGESRRVNPWRDEPGSTPSFAFIYRAPRPVKGVAAVAGLLRPSRDAVGRTHPLVIFSTLPDVLLSGGSHLLPLAMAGFLEGAARLARDAETMSSAAELEARLNQVPPPHLDAALVGGYDDWARTTPLHHAWHDMYGPKAPAIAPQTIHAMLEILKRFGGQTASTLRFGIRLPLGAVSPAESFWVHVCEQMAGPQVIVPTCFWEVEPTRQAILLQIGEATPSALGEAFVPDPKNERVCDFTRAVDPAGFAPMPAEIGAALMDQSTTVSQLLQLLAS